MTTKFSYKQVIEACEEMRAKGFAIVPVMYYDGQSHRCCPITALAIKKDPTYNPEKEHENGPAEILHITMDDELDFTKGVDNAQYVKKPSVDSTEYYKLGFKVAKHYGIGE